MALVVQKYGGSSVADADGIKRVAQRIVVTKKAGHAVVVVVSAMGDSTDELHDLARRVSPLPPARELDMLLTSGERISMALLARPSPSSARGPLVHRFPGRVITDDVHGKARIIDVTPGRISGALADGAIPIVGPGSRACPPTARTSPRSAGAARTPRRWRSPQRSRPTSVRFTPTWTASSPPIRGSCRPPGGFRRSGTRRCWRWRRRARRSCSCAAWSTPGGMTCPFMSGPRSATGPGPG